MNPKDYTFTTTMLQDWIKAEADKAHSMAVKYIEKNVDLIDTNLQKFMDDCPRSCQLEVYEMLLKAGVDMKDYVINGALKQWENYIHDTINYKQKLDEHIDKIVTWKTEWLHDTIALDTIPAIEEA